MKFVGFDELGNSVEIIGSDILVISAIAEPYCDSSTKTPFAENGQGYGIWHGS